MGVIDKLDIRRAQVQVEAIIVEVDVNKSSNLGVQWLLFGQGSSTVPAGVINLPGTGTSIVDLAALALRAAQGTTTTHDHSRASRERPPSAARPSAPAPPWRSAAWSTAA